jgi:hypothetical protein
MRYPIQSKARYFYTDVGEFIIIDNKIWASGFSEYRVFTKNTITAGIWDTSTHLSQNISTGYPQMPLFMIDFYSTAQKTR